MITYFLHFVYQNFTHKGMKIKKATNKLKTNISTTCNTAIFTLNYNFFCYKLCIIII